MTEENQSAEVVQDEVEVVENSAESTEAGDAEAKDPRFKWYVIKAMTGMENKVLKLLKERVVNLKMSEYVGDIIVPEEEVQTMVNGKKRRIKKKFFPGYVLINMIMNDNTWHLVQGTDKVTGFVGGTKDKPAAISDEEAAYMLGQAKDGPQKTRTTIDVSQGDSVRVIEGPFKTFIGTVEAVNERGKIRVNVSIFGRATPVDLDFSQIEKLS
jgi:transcriptional antiterminator NusG